MKNRGYVNPVMVPLVMAFLLVLVLGFTTFKYYGDYNRQKTQVDAIVAKAVSEAENNLTEKLNREHQEALKTPYETYTASSQHNAISVTYPRSWSSYVVAKETGNTVLDGYFHPGTVPDNRGDEKFALRMTLERADYAKEVEDYQKSVEKGELSASAITINQTKGIKLTGVIDRDTNGVLIILPVRDKVLKIWTEANIYSDDFNNVIAKKLTFDR